MRGLMTIASIVALATLVTPLVAQFTGDLASAGLLELMGFVTAAALFAPQPAKGA